MKRMLFVINTLGSGGAERSLLSLLPLLRREDIELSLFVLTGQGELAAELPEWVVLKNRKMDLTPVASSKGRLHLAVKVLAALFKNGHLLRKATRMLRDIFVMLRAGKVQLDKLCWQTLSDGAPRFAEEYDLAVAYLEGASTYYVSNYVYARQKVSLVHIAYGAMGYTRQLDDGCYERIDRILAVSDETKESFLKIHPECLNRMGVFYNPLNRSRILERACKTGGFNDSFDGIRLLTVGRLVWQKGYDVAIDAMRLLIDRGLSVRWYVLGEGSERAKLQRKIKALGLQNSFLLLGAVDNPYPYFRQTDVYIHATRCEGKSLAIQEAQILGCAIVASDQEGNREQLTDGVDGLLCAFTPESIADCVRRLAENPSLRKKLSQNAAKKEFSTSEKLFLTYLDEQELSLIH